MLIPSPTMIKVASVPNTMAAEALELLPAKQNAQRSLGFEAYMDLCELRRRFPNEKYDFSYSHGIEAGWQRCRYGFPDGSVILLWGDYGYDNQRPNKFSAFAVATSPDYEYLLT